MQRRKNSSGEPAAFAGKLKAITEKEHKAICDACTSFLVLGRAAADADPWEVVSYERRGSDPTWWQITHASGRQSVSTFLPVAIKNTYTGTPYADYFKPHGCLLCGALVELQAVQRCKHATICNLTKDGTRRFSVELVAEGVLSVNPVKAFVERESDHLAPLIREALLSLYASDGVAFANAHPVMNVFEVVGHVEKLASEAVAGWDVATPTQIGGLTNEQRTTRALDQAGEILAQAVETGAPPEIMSLLTEGVNGFKVGAKLALGSDPGFQAEMYLDQIEAAVKRLVGFRDDAKKIGAKYGMPQQQSTQYGS